MTGALATVLKAVADVNRQLGPAERLAEASETVLAGPQGKLDSLGLLNLIVAVEQRVAEECGQTIVLTDTETLSQAERIFATVGSLAEFVARRLQSRPNE